MAWLTGHCEVGTHELAEVNAYCSGQQYRDGSAGIPKALHSADQVRRDPTHCLREIATAPESRTLLQQDPMLSNCRSPGKPLHICRSSSPSLKNRKRVNKIHILNRMGLTLV